jgi:dUTP pyrophosphatase
MKHLCFEYVKIHPKATAPVKSLGDLGFDLSVVSDDQFYTYYSPGEAISRKFVLHPGQKKLFHTGLKIAIQPGYGALLRDRSGLGAKYGIHVLAGVIDNTYRGEWLIALLNTSDKNYEIVEGDRIAQAIIVPEFKIGFNEIKELDDTARGAKGFGSSGR